MEILEKTSQEVTRGDILVVGEVSYVRHGPERIIVTLMDGTHKDYPRDWPVKILPAEG